MYFFDMGHMGTIEISHVFHRQNHGVFSILWIWVNVIPTSRRSPEPWNHGFYREIIPFYGRKIQVSDFF